MLPDGPRGLVVALALQAWRWVWDALVDEAAGQGLPRSSVTDWHCDWCGRDINLDSDAPPNGWLVMPGPPAPPPMSFCCWRCLRAARRAGIVDGSDPVVNHGQPAQEPNR